MHRRCRANLGHGTDGPIGATLAGDSRATGSAATAEGSGKGVPGRLPCAAGHGSCPKNHGGETTLGVSAVPPI